MTESLRENTKKLWNDFIEKDTFTKTGIIIDAVFYMIVIYFSLMFLLLLWVSAGQALIWIIENANISGTQAMILVWIWATTPVLVIAYWAWNNSQKERKKKSSHWGLGK